MSNGAPAFRHVAPDCVDRVHFNTLRIRPRYRISLRLGEIDELFLAVPNTVVGRMARLQVLGLFYFPLGPVERDGTLHPRALEAFNGYTTPGGIRIPGCWEWVRDRIFHASSDDEADELIQHALRKRIVSGAEFPLTEIRGEGRPYGLPASDGFAKIRIPGGYSFATIGGRGRNRADGYDLEFGANLHDVETLYYRDNSVLGKIPLVATVERFADGTWEPATGVSVYFQLREPAEWPGESDAVPPNARFSRWQLPSSRRHRIEEWEAAHPSPLDPQTRNCHADFGGKRGHGTVSDGSTVADVVFAVSRTPGFNAAHTTRPLPHPGYPCAQPVTSDDLPCGPCHHAVRAATNDIGEAGVVFLPSRMGGDRYRIRAFVGHPTLRSNGVGSDAVSVDTGTLVVWRNIRVSRYLRKEVSSAGVWPELVTEAAEYGRWSGEERTDVPGEAHYVWWATALNGLPDLNVPRLQSYFARGFCELEFDGSGAPEPVPLEEYQRAYDRMQEEAAGVVPNLPCEINVPRLLHQAWHVPSFPNDNTVSLIVMRTPTSYNTPYDPESPARIPLLENGQIDPDVHASLRDLLLTDCFAPTFLSALSWDGFLPGLTLVHGAEFCTWSILGIGPAFGGIAQEYRGAFVLYGNDVYGHTGPHAYPHGFTTNSAHELGHCLFRLHAAAYVPDGCGPGYDEDAHDPPSDSVNDSCLMSYWAAPDEFCAKCLTALRGWNIDALP